MSNECFILFHEIVFGIEFLLYAAAMAGFYCFFITERQRKPGSRKIALLVFTIYIVGYPLFLVSWFHGWMHMVLVVGMLVLLSGTLGMERNFVFLLGILFQCIKSLTFMMTRSLDFYISQWVLEHAFTPEQVYRNAAWNYLLLQAVQFILFSLLLALAGQQLKKSVARLHGKELCYLLLTPATGILFTRIILRLLIINNEDHFFQLYDRFPLLTAIVPATAALFYAGILAAIAAWQKIIGLQETRRKYFVMEQQTAALQERIREMEQFHDGIRRMKHEMKNHLTNIRGLAESGHYEDMENYISRMDVSLNAFPMSLHTGNPVTDVIINDRQRAAAELGVSFLCAFVYPVSGGYDAYDIGIILTNLLCNALEACEKVPEGHRDISLSGRQKKKFFLIEVCNSYQGEITYDEHTRLPVSTRKTDSRNTAASLHGIGLSNVKQEAEKYGGDVEIQAHGQRFRVTVLLQERRTP